MGLMSDDDVARLLGLPAPDEDKLAERARATGERIRAARVSAGLTREQLGAAAGFSAEGIDRIESGLPGLGYYDYFALATPLHVDVFALWGSSSEREPKVADALAGAAPHWHMDDTLSACVRALAKWYDWDEFLSLVAKPDEKATPTALVARGVPDALEPAIGRRDDAVLDSGWGEPEVGPGKHDFELFSYQSRALSIASAIVGAAGLDPAQGVTAQELADAVGIPLGHKPLPERVRAAAGNALRRPLVILNSERADSVTNAAGLHMLAHLLCGHITLVAASIIGDNSHDDFGDCHGTSRDACALASWVANALRVGVPAAELELEKSKAEHDRIMNEEYDEDVVDRSPNTAIAQPEAPETGRQFDPDDWSTYTVDVRRRWYGDLAPSDHPDMDGRGNGDTILPAALARRHLACVAGGRAHDLSSELIASLGVGLPGRPTRDDVVAADTSYRTIRAQLDAWNGHAIGRAFGPAGAADAD